MDSFQLIGRTKDTDRYILFQLEDKDLFHACSSSKYYHELCNASFWFDKFYQTFGANLNQYGVIDYKNLYRKLRRMNDKEILRFAIDEEYVPLFEKMLEILEEFDDFSKIINSAFFAAAETGRIKIVKFILENSKWSKIVDIHAYHGFALTSAAARGHLGVVKYLFETIVENEGIKQALASIHANYDLALGRSAESGSLDVVKYLIETIAEYEGIKQALASIHENDDYALRSAAGNGYLHVIKYLIETVAEKDGIKGLNNILSNSSTELKQVKKIIINYIKDNDLLKEEDNNTIKEEDNRCKAITKKGTRCKNKTKNETGYCGIHNKL